MYVLVLFSFKKVKCDGGEGDRPFSILSRFFSQTHEQITAKTCTIVARLLYSGLPQALSNYRDPLSHSIPSFPSPLLFTPLSIFSPHIQQRIFLTLLYWLFINLMVHCMVEKCGKFYFYDIGEMRGGRRGGEGVIIFNLCKKIIQWSDYLRKDFSFVPCNGSIYVLSWKPGQAFLFTFYKVVISVCLEV